MKGRNIGYSMAELAFVEARQTMSRRALHAAFLAEFERADVTLDNIKSLCWRKRWASGNDGRFQKGIIPANKGKRCPPGKGGRHPNARKTQFKKGGLPHNTHYLGHERVSKDGYVEISVDETNPHTGYERRYVLKHRHLWELANGPVPKGMALKCRDSNRQNTDPDNWQLVPRALLPRALLPRLNGGRRKKHLAYDEAPDELKPTIMAVAKLEHAAREARSR